MNLFMELALPTSLNQLYINQAKYNPKAKKYVSTGKRILSDEAKHCKRMIQKYAKKQLKKQEWDYEYTKANFIYMDTVIYFNRKGRDDNNVYKLLCDALEGIVYDNDSRVLIRTQRIYYDKDNPRVEVTFSPVEFVGVFDSVDELYEFEEKCRTCRRYRKGSCKILKEAIGGRIQEELDEEGKKCSEYIEKKGS